LLGEQALRTIAVCARELELRLRALALGRKPRDLGLERPRIYREQQVASRHAAALVEMHGLDETADPRPDLDVARRLEPAREVRPVAELADGDLGGRDGRRRRRGGGLL